ncbi:MAG: hypothetical protein ACLFXM_07985, partial [Acidimicrobiia bacterium]
SNVTEALSDWYRHTVGDALVNLGAHRGLDLSEVRGPGNHRHLLLHPPEMPIVGSDPAVGIGVGWLATSASPPGLSTFACVRRSDHRSAVEVARALMEAGGREVRSGIRDARGKDDEAWPIWWWIAPGERWWTDLDAYCSSITGEVRRLLDPLRDVLCDLAGPEIEDGSDPR